MERLLLTPGFIDSHMFGVLGGGEGGFANRTRKQPGRTYEVWSSNSCWLPWEQMESAVIYVHWLQRQKD